MQRYESAFDEVVEIYNELKSVDGQISQQSYGQANTHGDNSRLVKPSDQDFICDVELSFQKVMPTMRDGIDLKAVLLGTPISDSTRNRVKQRVGREFVRRQIFPVHIYFKGMEIERGS